MGSVSHMGTVSGSQSRGNCYRRTMVVAAPVLDQTYRYR
jgi:hypothetical protein